ncbi:hypothetical protein ABIB76_007729, partial [Bradyrhizobium sp. i1.12.3]|uniref:hypothetical protein n=1 Tax=Bradyrhizobium sp. i1.12.3 TaxID=3156359 RepID=UPI003D1B6BDD
MPPLGDVGTILFAGVRAFFEADLLGGEEARDSIDVSASTPCVPSRRSAIASSLRSFSLRRSSGSQSLCG